MANFDPRLWQNSQREAAAFYTRKDGEDREAYRQRLADREAYFGNRSLSSPAMQAANAHAKWSEANLAMATQAHQQWAGNNPKPVGLIAEITGAGARWEQRNQFLTDQYQRAHTAHKIALEQREFLDRYAGQDAQFDRWIVEQQKEMRELQATWTGKANTYERAAKDCEFWRQELEVDKGALEAWRAESAYKTEMANETARSFAGADQAANAAYADVRAEAARQKEVMAEMRQAPELADEAVRDVNRELEQDARQTAAVAKEAVAAAPEAKVEAVQSAHADKLLLAEAREAELVSQLPDAERAKAETAIADRAARRDSIIARGADRSPEDQARLREVAENQYAAATFKSLSEKETAAEFKVSAAEFAKAAAAQGTESLYAKVAPTQEAPAAATTASSDVQQATEAKVEATQTAAPTYPQIEATGKIALAEAREKELVAQLPAADRQKAEQAIADRVERRDNLIAKAEGRAPEEAAKIQHVAETQYAASTFESLAAKETSAENKSAATEYAADAQAETKQRGTSLQRAPEFTDEHRYTLDHKMVPGQSGQPSKLEGAEALYTRQTASVNAAPQQSQTATAEVSRASVDQAKADQGAWKQHERGMARHEAKVAQAAVAQAPQQEAPQAAPKGEAAVEAAPASAPKAEAAKAEVAAPKATAEQSAVLDASKTTSSEQAPQAAEAAKQEAPMMGRRISMIQSAQGAELGNQQAAEDQEAFRQAAGVREDGTHPQARKDAAEQSQTQSKVAAATDDQDDFRRAAGVREDGTHPQARHDRSAEQGQQQGNGHEDRELAEVARPSQAALEAQRRAQEQAAKQGNGQTM